MCNSNILYHEMFRLSLLELDFSQTLTCRKSDFPMETRLDSLICKVGTDN